jgi:hypothetical protein
MFTKFKGREYSQKTARKIKKYFGSLEQAYSKYKLQYEPDQHDLFLLFREICSDTHLQAQIGDEKYAALLDTLRQEFLDEGEFGKHWLSGQHIFNTMKTLEKKNQKYSFLGLISFDCELMYDSITSKFEREFQRGKR